MSSGGHIVGSVMFTETEEELREKRKRLYESPNVSPYLDEWEHDGYGYAISYRPDERNQYLLFRTDLVNYYTICYQFVRLDLLEERIKREVWQPTEATKVTGTGQMLLEL